MATTRSSRPKQAIRWFDLDAVGRAPARFDFAKLDNLNGHYIRAADDDRLVALVAERLEQTLGRTLSETHRDRLRARNARIEAAPEDARRTRRQCRFLVAARPILPDAKAAKLLTPEARALLAALAGVLDRAEWRADALERCVRDFADAKGVKLGAVAQPLRAALTGSLASPGIFVVMEVLGREETLGRIADAVERSLTAPHLALANGLPSGPGTTIFWLKPGMTRGHGDERCIDGRQQYDHRNHDPDRQ